MNKITIFLKKTLKALLWIIISVVLLIIIVALLLQVPSIQTKVVNYATSYVSNKTHTKVELKKISITFPKSVLIEGLYLEDLKKDTLLYAGELKINLAFRDLFDHHIHISSVGLENISLKVDRSENDSLFNYNFLLTAFSDSTKKDEPTTKEKSSWIVSVDDVSLENIRIKYNDQYGGTNFKGSLKNISLKMNELDLANSVYKIDELLVDNLSADILITSGHISDKNSESVLPKIIADKIEIKNTKLIYGDSINKQSLIADLNRFKLKDGAVDLQKQTVGVNNISLSKSNIRFNTTAKVINDSIVGAVDPANTNNWVVAVKDIDLENNAFAYMVMNKPEIKKVFDADHLDYKKVTLKAKDLSYSTSKTEVEIKKFNAIDQNGFAITKLETKFSMDEHSVTANKLKIKTRNSSIDGNFDLHYSSLKSLKDSIQFMVVNADMKKVSVTNSDITYFSPDLAKQAFFKNTKNVTTVSGNIKGPINNLSGENVTIRTGVNTIAKTDFKIAGLPNIQTATFSFPNLILNSGKTDIVMMAGPAIPKSIELPEIISMKINFEGQIKAFETTMGMSSSYGTARVSAKIDKNENFRSKVDITAFDLGRLLKNKEMFGPVTLTASTTGRGFDKKTIKATVQAHASQIYLNKYSYHALDLDGAIAGQQFEGKISLDDPNAAFDFDGLVNLNPKQEQYKFNFNLKGADLQKLNITKDDIRIGLVA
ncbi:MAG: hypothetical protein H0X46_08805, partial [Bacteroidetes bacterium]|nr:hypothetical protein [Bacteroidota bacterium]